MNKKILISLSVIAAVAAIAVGGTIAYFSDVETSTGNTFTAGSIDLKVDLDRDGYHIWDLKDLVAGTDKFFDYEDVKPGDDGELTVSAHVYSNDAYGCFYVYPQTDSDNGCTEPELEAELGCTNTGDGELDDNLMFRIWLDQGYLKGWQCPENEPACSDDPAEGNNVIDIERDIESYDYPITYCGSTGNEWCYLSDIDEAGEVWPLGYMVGSDTYYYGIEWELPWDTGNDVQSDQWSADVSFYVEQAKNNSGFVCPPPAD